MSSPHHSQGPPTPPPDSPMAKTWAVVRSRWRQEPLHPPTSMNLSQSPMAKFFEGPGAPPPQQRHGYRQGYRPGKSDGVLIAWSVFCVIWFLGAAYGGEGASNPGMVFGIIFVIWVGPAFLLTIIYLMARAGRRRCPVCGTHVPTGRTQCAGCGHNFALAARR